MAIDPVLCSITLTNTLSWSFSEHLYGSDHFPITIDYQRLNSTNHETNCFEIEKRWNYKRANWKIDSEYFENQAPSKSSNIQIDTTMIKQAIVKAANISIPKTSTQHFCRKPENNTLENRTLLRQLEE